MAFSLFSTERHPAAADISSLILRIVFGGLMAPHGFQKMMNFAQYEPEFLDFMGLGTSISLALTIFSEFFCSLLLVLGLATRVVPVAPIITGIVIVFVAHKGEIFGDAFSGFAYLVAYIVIMLLGPGKYSLDHLIRKRK